MCTWKMQKTDRLTCLVSKKTKRELRLVQERKIVSVCVGIDHMVKRRKMLSEGKRVDLDHCHYSVCRLCQSTKRVLNIIRAHNSQKHDTLNCGACRMWAMVMERCASLDIPIDVEINDKSPPVDAGAAGISRPVVPFNIECSSCK